MPRLSGRSSCGKLPYRTEIQTELHSISSSRTRLQSVEQDFPVGLLEDNVRMTSADDGRRTASGGFTADFYIQFLRDTFLQLDVNPVLTDEPLSGFQTFRRKVLDDLQPVVRLPDQDTQGNGDRQPDHPCARDAHSHGVLQDVGGKQYADFFRFLSQQLCGTCGTQRHRHRLRTAHGRNYLPVDQLDNLFSDIRLKHNDCYGLV